MFHQRLSRQGESVQTARQGAAQRRGHPGRPNPPGLATAAEPRRAEREQLSDSAAFAREQAQELGLVAEGVCHVLLVEGFHPNPELSRPTITIVTV